MRNDLFQQRHFSLAEHRLAYREAPSNRPGEVMAKLETKDQKDAFEKLNDRCGKLLKVYEQAIAKAREKRDEDSEKKLSDQKAVLERGFADLMLRLQQNVERKDSLLKQFDETLRAYEKYAGMKDAADLPTSITGKSPYDVETKTPTVNQYERQRQIFGPRFNAMYQYRSSPRWDEFTTTYFKIRSTYPSYTSEYHLDQLENCLKEYTEIFEKEKGNVAPSKLPENEERTLALKRSEIGLVNREGNIDFVRGGLEFLQISRKGYDTDPSNVMLDGHKGTVMDQSVSPAAFGITYKATPFFKEGLSPYQIFNVSFLKPGRYFIKLHGGQSEEVKYTIDVQGEDAKAAAVRANADCENKWGDIGDLASPGFKYYHDKATGRIYARNANGFTCRFDDKQGLWIQIGTVPANVKAAPFGDAPKKASVAKGPMDDLPAVAKYEATPSIPTESPDARYQAQVDKDPYASAVYAYLYPGGGWRMQTGTGDQYAKSGKGVLYCYDHNGKYTVFLNGVWAPWNRTTDYSKGDKPAGSVSSTPKSAEPLTTAPTPEPTTTTEKSPETKGKDPVRAALEKRARGTFYASADFYAEAGLPNDGRAYGFNNKGQIEIFFNGRTELYAEKAGTNPAPTPKPEPTPAPKPPEAKPVNEYLAFLDGLKPDGTVGKFKAYPDAVFFRYNGSIHSEDKAGLWVLSDPSTGKWSKMPADAMFTYLDGKGSVTTKPKPPEPKVEPKPEVKPAPETPETPETRYRRQIDKDDYAKLVYAYLTPGGGWRMQAGTGDQYALSPSGVLYCYDHNGKYTVFLDGKWAPWDTKTQYKPGDTYKPEPASEPSSPKPDEKKPETKKPEEKKPVETPVEEKKPETANYSVEGTPESANFNRTKNNGGYIVDAGGTTYAIIDGKFFRKLEKELPAIWKNGQWEKIYGRNADYNAFEALVLSKRLDSVIAEAMKLYGELGLVFEKTADGFTMGRTLSDGSIGKQTYTAKQLNMTDGDFSKEGPDWFLKFIKHDGEYLEGALKARKEFLNMKDTIDRYYGSLLDAYGVSRGTVNGSCLVFENAGGDSTSGLKNPPVVARFQQDAGSSAKFFIDGKQIDMNYLTAGTIIANLVLKDGETLADKERKEAANKASNFASKLASLIQENIDAETDPKHKASMSVRYIAPESFVFSNGAYTETVKCAYDGTYMRLSYSSAESKGEYATWQHEKPEDFAKDTVRRLRERNEGMQEEKELAKLLDPIKKEFAEKYNRGNRYQVDFDRSGASMWVRAPGKRVDITFAERANPDEKDWTKREWMYARNVVAYYDGKPLTLRTPWEQNAGSGADLIAESLGIITWREASDAEKGTDMYKDRIGDPRGVTYEFPDGRRALIGAKGDPKKPENELFILDKGGRALGLEERAALFQNIKRAGAKPGEIIKDIAKDTDAVITKDGTFIGKRGQSYLQKLEENGAVAEVEWKNHASILRAQVDALPGKRAKIADLLGVSTSATEYFILNYGKNKDNTDDMRFCVRERAQGLRYYDERDQNWRELVDYGYTLDKIADNLETRYKMRSVKGFTDKPGSSTNSYIFTTKDNKTFVFDCYRDGDRNGLYHVYDFNTGEDLTFDSMQKIEDEIAKRLGFLK